MATFVMPACSNVQALKVWSPPYLAARDLVGSVECVCCKAQKRRMPGARILPLRASRQRRCGPRPGRFSHHARARQLLAQAEFCSRVTSARSCRPPALPHDDRAVIEIRSLTLLQTLAIRMPVPYRSWANKRCSPSRKPRMRTTSSGVSTTGKRRDGRGLPIS